MGFVRSMALFFVRGRTEYRVSWYVRSRILGLVRVLSPFVARVRALGAESSAGLPTGSHTVSRAEYGVTRLADYQGGERGESQY